MIQSLNAENTYNKSAKPATVRLTPNGFIRFSAQAVADLNLKEGDKLEFFLDDVDRSKVHFAITTKGFPLKHADRRKQNVSLQICCRPLPLKILTHLKLKEPITIRLNKEKVLYNKHQCWAMDTFNKHIPTKWN